MATGLGRGVASVVDGSFNMLKIGDIAPNFFAKDQHGYDTSLSTLLRDGPLVLYFYPRDFSFVCTREACAFRDEHAALTIAGAMVCGVSVDSSTSHERFSALHNIPYPLIADPGREIVSNYDVRSLFGPFAKRVTYVIGTDRRVRSVHHHEFSAQRHVADVRAVLLSIGVDVAAV
jgi:peroxiredoxin Q/BCP